MKMPPDRFRGLALAIAAGGEAVAPVADKLDKSELKQAQYQYLNSGQSAA
jgi:hypothetical protein